MSQRIALIGASGKIGSKIAAELLARGHQVTGIARNAAAISAADGLTAVAADVNDPAALAAELRGHDAVIAATTFLPGLVERLLEALRGSGVKRFLIVGGAASLLTEAGGQRIFDTLPPLPEPVLAQISEGMRTLQVLKTADDLDWTFLSPAVFIGPGERSGKFRLGGDVVVKDADGNSKISYDDYAIAMVDELEQGKHIKARFTVAY
jgi:putative NADH-flavin reductase